MFFLQNNHWAISVPVSTQSAHPCSTAAAASASPSVQIDGNDVLASYAVTARASTRRAAAPGPAAIEALTYRMGAHTTSDDPTKYRTSEEEQSWALRDPIERIEAFLRGRGASDAFFAGVAARRPTTSRTIPRAHPRAGDAHAEPMFAHVYSEPHPLIDEQRALAADYEASFEEDGAA